MRALGKGNTIFFSFFFFVERTSGTADSVAFPHQISQMDRTWKTLPSFN